ncbi:hypothetical protein [Paenibacillus solani]|nr:hypothetical protein [Paenibacillus solani]
MRKPDILSGISGFFLLSMTKEPKRDRMVAIPYGRWMVEVQHDTG